MAGLRKLRGKWYVRVYLGNGKEKLLPTKTGDRKLAEVYRRKVAEREFLVRARLVEDITQDHPNLNEAVDDFLRDCKTRLQPNTVRNYRLALDALISCWGNPHLTDLTPRHLTAIREYLADRVGSTTVNINLRGIRRFLNWCVETDRLERLPGRISFVKEDHPLPKFFIPNEIERILAATPDPKLRATFQVLSSTGLRRSELYHATLEGNYLRVSETKDRKERIVHFPSELIPAFHLATHKPYHHDTITQAFRKAMNLARIDPKGRSLHCLRHSFALREYASTRDIYYVKELLGHSSVTVTEIYMRFPLEYLAQVFGQDPATQAEQDARQGVRRPPFEA